MKTLTLAIALVGITSLAFAQKKDDGQELIDAFFDIYKRKGYESALKYAWTTNKWIEVEGGEMNNIILKLQKQVATMGDYFDHEEIRAATLGSRYRIVSYLVYYTRDPVRFTFELYKSSGGWEIAGFDFDVDFEKELEDSIRIGQ